MTDLQIDCVIVPETDSLTIGIASKRRSNELFLTCQSICRDKDFTNKIVGINLSVETATQLRDYLTQFIDEQNNG